MVKRWRYYLRSCCSRKWRRLESAISPFLIPGRKRSSLPPTVSATSTSSRRRRRRRKAAANGDFRVDASDPSTEAQQAMFSSQLFSPELGDGHSAPSAVLQPPVQPPAPSWIQAGLEEMKRKSMKNRCCGFVLHLMDHPEDLDLVHSVLQAEFIAERRSSSSFCWRSLRPSSGGRKSSTEPQVS
ncbi:hypothetical protein CHARACLAT_023648 [Characodon lateralis]|uniref:Uncharacterized protein n=1 Tax=Characodon lateralis TaxID=208331 RepID=A0ABU7F6G1_9TELE|nr:hypothetical protein [Characodon lateralis]